MQHQLELIAKILLIASAFIIPACVAYIIKLQCDIEREEAETHYQRQNKKVESGHVILNEIQGLTNPVVRKKLLESLTNYTKSS